MGWILTIIVGGLAGWIAEKVMKFDTGLLANIGLGIAGSIVGNLLLGGMIGGSLIWPTDTRCCRRLCVGVCLPVDQGPQPSLGEWPHLSILLKMPGRVTQKR